MKKTITAAWILLFPFLLSAQIGLINGYQALHAPNWEKAAREAYGLPDVKIFSPSIFTGINLYLPSKNKGIQWTPELHFSRHQVNITFDNPDMPNDPNFGSLTDFHRTTMGGLSFNGEFFLLRLAYPEHDPMLENFSALKRGLFLRLGMGFDLISQSKRSNTLNFGFGFGNVNRAYEFAGHLRIGLGVEHEITPFLSITPILSSTFYSKTSWTGINQPTDSFTFDPFGGPITNPSPSTKDIPKDAFIHWQAAIRLKINLKEFRAAFRKEIGND